ncbi:MAG TPA: response regulator [Anaerolineales bacterium]|nr:response regulator [Anaerolineales bacterium]
MEKQPYILIVDDDPDILEGILTILETQSYRLATARDGKKCMELLQEELPDVLILDLLMPRMDGWGVIREMRNNPRFAKVPIMILTTVIEDASRRRYELETGMTMDVQDYIQKPARPADLIQRVARLIATGASKQAER